MPLYRIDNASLLFVHIPKTGGTSIEFGLAGHLVGFLDRRFRGRFFPCSPQHFHREILESVLDLSKVDYTFAIVRHPLDRLKSEYTWMRSYFGIKDEFNVWAIRALHRYIENSYFHDNHFRPMVDFLIPGIELFRLEDGLDPVFQKITELFPAAVITSDKSAKMRSGGRTSLSVSSELRQLVEQIYRADFEAFNY